MRSQDKPEKKQQEVTGSFLLPIQLQLLAAVTASFFYYSASIVNFIVTLTSV